MTQSPSAPEIASTLTRLHEFKDRSYKDAWRLRGELIGIFSNIARKYDRLQVAQDEVDPDEVEPRADTSADLCIYSVKYVTWLIEHDPGAAAAIAGADSELWSGTLGHAAVAPALERLAAYRPVLPASLPAGFHAVAQPFGELEELLVEQHGTTAAAKTALAWQLAGASFGYLWRLALDEHVAWERFTDYVAHPA